MRHLRGTDRGEATTPPIRIQPSTSRAPRKPLLGRIVVRPLLRGRRDALRRRPPPSASTPRTPSSSLDSRTMQVRMRGQQATEASLTPCFAILEHDPGSRRKTVVWRSGRACWMRDNFLSDQSPIAGENRALRSLIRLFSDREGTVEGNEEWCFTRFNPDVSRVSVDTLPLSVTRPRRFLRAPNRASSRPPEPCVLEPVGAPSVRRALSPKRCRRCWQSFRPWARHARTSSTS